RPERTRRAGARDQLLDLRRRHAERAEQLLVPVEGGAERVELAGRDGALAGRDGRRDLVEEPFMPIAIGLPARPETADRRAGAAWSLAERDDQRQRPRNPEGRARRGLAADEAEADAERGRRRVDARGMAVEDRLEAPPERQLVVAREPAPGGRRERAQRRDGERGGAPESDPPPHVPPDP